MLKRPTCAGKHHQCDPHIAWSGVPWQQLSRPWQNWQGNLKRQGSSSKFWKFVEQRELLMFSDFLQNHDPLQRIFVDGAIPQVLLWCLMSHPCSRGWMAEVQLRCYDSRLKFQCPQEFKRIFFMFTFPKIWTRKNGSGFVWTCMASRGVCMGLPK